VMVETASKPLAERLVQQILDALPKAA